MTWKIIYKVNFIKHSVIVVINNNKSNVFFQIEKYKIVKQQKNIINYKQIKLIKNKLWIIKILNNLKLESLIIKLDYNLYKTIILLK